MSFALPELCMLPFLGRTGETVSTPQYHFAVHERGHKEYVIFQWTTSGYGCFEIDGVTHRVPPEHAFLAFVPERSQYFYPPDATQPWTFSWMNFHGPVAMDLFRRFREKFGPVIPLPTSSTASTYLRELSRMLAEHHFPDPYEASGLLFRFVMEWTRLLTLPSREKRDPIGIALALCATHYREPFGIKELADRVGLTREHLSRLFRERTGLSPGAHLRGLRLDTAHHLKRETHLPDSEIALLSGFSSPQALRRALKSHHSTA